MYQKLIISGNLIEKFDYEHSPATRKNEATSVYNGVVGCRRLLQIKDVSRLSEKLVKRRDNAIRAKMAFERLCRSNFVGTEVATFCTFTFSGEQDVSSGFKFFSLFTKRLRTRFGQGIRYVAVPEFGKRSTKRLHFHALIWGLPVSEIDGERKTRLIAKIWRYGFVDLVVTDNKPEIGYYLAKYLTKCYTDIRFFNHSSYVCSRNINRPIYYSGFVDLTLDYGFDITVDKLPIVSRSYDTLWLGRCDYKQYLIE